MSAPAPAAPDQQFAAGLVAGRGLAATTAVVRDTHAAIADRIFRLTGPAATPVRVMHQGISRGVYAAVGGGLRAAGVAAGVAAAVRPASRPLTDTPAGDLVVGALNGAWGDALETSRSALALPMAVRVRGTHVPLTPDGLAGAFPAATGDVVVWLHGLCETDRAWWLGAEKQYGDAGSSHGSRLDAEAGTTSVYLRYNTGRHISDNGAELVRVLDALVAGWPVPVTRLTLVGHSMGGLVIRAACCLEDGSAWLPLVRRVVYLGSPHLGAPLELGAAAVTVALQRLPETRPLGRALASRSVGIKDLRYGDIQAADWADLDLDAWRREPDAACELLATATHYYIGATVTRQQDHIAARVIGDALVTFPSSSGTGRRRRLALDVDRGRHLGGLHHFDLLNHPRVWAVLRGWLTAPDVPAE